MSQFVGELAALFAALSWTFASTLFTSAGRRIGALNLNAFRIVIGASLLSIAHFFLYGSFFPLVNISQFFYLSLSGIIGLAIGDFAYFGSLITIGPRKAILVSSMAPIFSLIGGYIVLQEIPSLISGIGVFLVLLGIWIVIIEREEKEDVRGNKLKGVALGIIAAAGQGIGVVISKYGMLKAGSVVAPLSAALIRVVVASLVIWLMLFAWKGPRQLFSSLKDRTALKISLLGSFIGPFVGLWLSMIAINYAQVGIASTLMSLTPIMIIPVVHFVYGEHVNLRGIAGAIIAVIGVALIFLF